MLRTLASHVLLALSLPHPLRENASFADGVRTRISCQPAVVSVQGNANGPTRASCKRFDGRLALRWSFPAGCGLLVMEGCLPGEPDPLTEERRDQIQARTSASAGVVTKTGSYPVVQFG